MDEHRKMAEEIVRPHMKEMPNCSDDDGEEDHTNCPVYQYVKEEDILIERISDSLRSTASKSENDGWNKAVEECGNQCLAIVCRQIGIYVEIAKISQHDKERLKQIDEIGMTFGGIKSDMADAIRRLIREDGK